MKRENFVRLIESLKSSVERQEELSRRVYESVIACGGERDFFDPYTMYSAFGTDSLVGSVLDAVMAEFEDPDVIEYWVWDLQWGREFTPGCISDDSGDIDLSTADALYDAACGSPRYLR